MVQQVFSGSTQGIDAHQVRVQIDSSPGIHSLSIVGLADKAVQESQERINAAIRNSGFAAPQSKNKRFTVNLAPADTKKEGSAFDLPIAVAYLVESKQVTDSTDSIFFAGELSLNGSLSPINGILSMALLAKRSGCREMIVPRENEEEGSFVEGIDIVGADNLSQVVAHLNKEVPLTPAKRVERSSFCDVDDSFAHITGQYAAKRALTIAAAGSHNILMSGPPGSGKTLLARAICGLMPTLSESEIVEVAKIYSSIGLLKGSPLNLERPFRSPHHTASPASIVGGGTWPRPGEISLAHRGILFLDEFPEFARNVLEALRQPLEDGVVTISRASGTLELPAKFMLIAAMNPCPCGNAGDPRTTCSCAPAQIARYVKKISGPLLDRLDIHISVPRESGNSKASKSPDRTGFEKARDAVKAAKKSQNERFSGQNLVTNSDISHRNIENYCPMNFSAASLLGRIADTRSLSLRATHRIRKVARTIADMDGSSTIGENHVAEAIALRMNG